MTNHLCYGQLLANTLKNVFLQTESQPSLRDKCEQLTLFILYLNYKTK